MNSLVRCYVLTLAVVSLSAGAPPVPTELPGLHYEEPFFPETRYRPEVPTGESLLGFPLARQAATGEQIEYCLRTWAAAMPDRTRLVEYARSHEDRPLHYLVVTAPENLVRLDELQADHARLGDPRRLTDAEAEVLMDRLPGVAWLAHAIHGDELEGSDAALAVVYHLLAAEDPAVERLLRDLIIIVDPLMNPDGRARFLNMLNEHRGTAPNVDDQSLLQRGYWPYGRGNHYLFDLNRDWILCRHPETRGRVRAVREWLPQLFVDAHGMGAQDTHLFSPPREPVNPHLPADRAKWLDRFAKDQAAALDRHRLVYYTGEWHEEWYPGYSDAWASYHGAIGILYEQARVTHDAVRRPEGRLLSYRESVRHHVIGAMANLQTLQANRRQLLRHHYQSRQSALDPQGVYAARTFAIPPSANHSRWNDLIDLLELQGFELYETATVLAVTNALDQLGNRRGQVELPRGTVLVPARQPLGRMVAALLEFDTRFSQDVLAEERRQILRTGSSRIYDVTSWSLTMLYGLPAYELPIDLPDGVRPRTATEPTASPIPEQQDASLPVAYVLDGADDHSVAAAARLMERGVEVRLADKAFRLDERDFDRGSVVVTPLDNRHLADVLAARVQATAAELGLSLHLIGSGLGAGDLPDLGGRHFRRLEPPQLAVLGREGVASTDFGAIWYAIDQMLGIRHSHLSTDRRADLRRYNVLVIPDASAAVLTQQRREELQAWVREGGTLIAVAGAAASLADSNSGLSAVRLLSDVLDQVSDYELTVLREWMAQERSLPSSEAIWSHRAGPGLDYPWRTNGGDDPDEKERKRRDSWQQLFMPRGVFLASRTDTNHWLTVGCDRLLPVLVGAHPVLMSRMGIETPVRYGWLAPAEMQPSRPLQQPASDTASVSPSGGGPQDDSATVNKGENAESLRIGWCALPAGTDLHLRMSGLLWPEATHRLANTAAVTRESLGRGQVILFASPPAFRGSTRGTLRLFLNAVVYGPGCGTGPRIRLGAPTSG